MLLASPMNPLLPVSTPSLHTAVNKTAQHKSLPPAGLGNKPFGRNFSCTPRRWATASNGGHNNWEVWSGNLLTLAGPAKGRHTLPWWGGGCRGPVALGGSTGRTRQPPGTAPPPLPRRSSPAAGAAPRNLPDAASPPCPSLLTQGQRWPGPARLSQLPPSATGHACSTPLPSSRPGPRGRACCPPLSAAGHSLLHRPEWGSPGSRVPSPPSPGGASCCPRGRRPGCSRAALLWAER